MVHIINRPTLTAIAAQEAQKSPCIHHVGAIITHGTGNKPIVTGHNSNKRSAYRIGKIRNIKCCQHAEMSVAVQLINSLIRRGIHTKGARVSF